MSEIRLHGSNQEYYLRESRRVRCSMYEPCPICYKCKVRASHLYRKCEACRVPICRHSEKDRAFMIRRENFAIKESQLGPDAIEAFRNLGRKLKSSNLTEKKPGPQLEGEVADAYRKIEQKARTGDWLDPADPSALRLNLSSTDCSCGEHQK